MTPFWVTLTHRYRARYNRKKSPLCVHNPVSTLSIENKTGYCHEKAANVLFFCRQDLKVCTEIKVRISHDRHHRQVLARLSEVQKTVGVPFHFENKLAFNPSLGSSTLSSNYLQPRSTSKSTPLSVTALLFLNLLFTVHVL